ncbi:MAG: hypothetical protein JNM69_22685 [Archangium sp.]|nr:hypothetical protein [Archangium sp.]
MNEPLRLLTGNAALQVLVSCLLGFAMLVPRQPWAKRLAPHFDQKALLSVHLDWLMLAFMQWGAVLVMTQWPGAAQPWVAWLLVVGGWLNVVPYWCRAFRIDAFVLAGPPVQLVAASVSGLSATGLLVAWGRLGWEILG